jgi:molybdate transport system permease protein
MARRGWTDVLSRLWFPALVAVLAVVVLVFLVLPVLAIFVHTPPSALIAKLGDGEAQDALRLSVETTVIAMLVTVLIGTPVAYGLARSRFRGRDLVITLIEVPLVLPPAVAGIGLLAALGPEGLLGPALANAHIQLVLTTAGVVVALIFVSAPFYLRQAEASFAALDQSLLDASRSLGASRAKTFMRVAIPVALPGLAAGLALAWARALGEFGATLMFAGSFRGITQTMPLAIYDQFATDFPAALALSAVLVVIGAALLIAVKVAFAGGGQLIATPGQRR